MCFYQWFMVTCYIRYLNIYIYLSEAVACLYFDHHHHQQFTQNIQFAQNILDSTALTSTLPAALLFHLLVVIPGPLDRLLVEPMAGQVTDDQRGQQKSEEHWDRGSPHDARRVVEMYIFFNEIICMYNIYIY